MSVEEAKSYDTEVESSHRVLLGKKLWIEVFKKDGKYSSVPDKGWRSEAEAPSDAMKSEAKQTAPPAQQPAAAAPASAPAEPASNSLGDIPF